MANKKAAIKSLRQDKKKHEINKAAISELRTFAKKAQTLMDEKNREGSDTVLKKLESKLYRAAKTNKIKKKNASRRISRLRSQWAKISA